MAEEEKRFSRQLLGKTVVSKTGKRFGEVGDMIFETRSGELIHLILANPTAYTEKLELEKDKEGNILIPFSAVIAIGDFLVIAEEDIIQATLIYTIQCLSQHYFQQRENPHSLFFLPHDKSHYEGLWQAILEEKQCLFHSKNQQQQ